MRRGFKLSSLDPETVAAEVATEVLGAALSAANGLSPAVVLDVDRSVDLTNTKVHKLVRSLVVYAQGGRRPATVPVAIDVLAHWCGEDAVKTSTKQKTGLQLVLTAVEAREALDRGEALSSPHVAALCDLDRDHVNGMAGRGEIPGAYRSDESAHLPWRFKGAAFRKWLAARTEADRELLAEVAP